MAGNLCVLLLLLETLLLPKMILAPQSLHKNTSDLNPPQDVVATDVEEEEEAVIPDDYDASSNYTSEEDYLDDIREFIFPRAWTWGLIACHIVVFVGGTVGNVLVCAAVYRNRTMRTVTNYFIANLAVADFLVILLCLPPSVIWDVTLTWFFGTVFCKIVLYLQTVSVTVSILTLAFISVDRWYAICFPLKFKSTTRRAKTAIVAIWLLALIFDIPELVVYSAVPNPYIPIKTVYFTQCEPSWSPGMDTAWMVLKMALLYIVPLVFMSVAYIQIIMVLWRSGAAGSGNYHCTIASNASTRGQLRSRKKAAKMLVSVVGMFALCYFPVHLLSVLRVTVKLDNSESNQAFALISHWLCYANSAVNPLIYNFMSGKFRKEFRRFINCCSSQRFNNAYEMSSRTTGGTRRRTLLTDIPFVRSDSTKLPSAKSSNSNSTTRGTK